MRLKKKKKKERGNKGIEKSGQETYSDSYSVKAQTEIHENKHHFLE